MVRGMLDQGFERLAAGYEKALKACLGAPVVIVLILLGIAAGAYTLFRRDSRRICAAGRSGNFLCDRQGCGGNEHRLYDRPDQETRAPLMPLVESGDIQRALVRAPSWGQTAPNGGIIIISMAPWDKRKVSTAEAQGRMMGAWSQFRMFVYSRSCARVFHAMAAVSLCNSCWVEPITKS